MVHSVLPKEVIPVCPEAPAGRRASEEEKECRPVPTKGGIRTVENPANTGQVVQQAYAEEGKAALRKLQEAAIKNENMFEVLMEATKYCSLMQLTEAMFEVGGQYRRNM